MWAKINKYSFLVIYCAATLILMGCNATRFVRTPDVLLKNDPSIEYKGELDEGLLYQAVRTEANRRMLLPKTALHIHNVGVGMERVFLPKKQPIADEDSVKGVVSRTIRFIKYRMGEPPVLLDTVSLNEDLANLRRAMFARGYFYPTIGYSIDTSHKFLRRRQQKAKVTFQVEGGPVFRIREVDVKPLEQNEHTEFFTFQYSNPSFPTLLQPGDRYDHRTFDAERTRGTSALRNSGFLYFSPSMINFVLDTMLSVNKPDSLGNFPDERWMDVTIELLETPQLYRIRDVLVNIIGPPREGASGQTISLSASQLDSLGRDSLGITSKVFASTLPYSFNVSPTDLHRINYNFLSNRIYIGDNTERLFLQRELDQTQRRLQELNMVQYLLINTQPVSSDEVQAVINLNLAPRYRVKFGAEAFTRDITAQNATFLPSLGANLGLRNRNAFGKSELFEVSFSGSVGLLANQSDNTDSEGNTPRSSNSLFYEVGGSASLNIPRFLGTAILERVLSERRKRNINSYNPNTVLETGFNLENYGDLTQLAPSVQLTYQWRNHRSEYVDVDKKTVEFTRFTPFSFSLITPSLRLDLDEFENDVTPGQIIDVSSDTLLSTLEREVVSLPPGLYQDFLPRFSSSMQLTFTHQNYRAYRDQPTYYFQVGIEWGGNALALLEQVVEEDVNIDDGKFLNRFYGQYARGSLEGKVFIPTGSSSELVFRGAVGGARALGGTPIVPRQARFFTGGINGMRGWQSNTLGPGRVRYSQDLGGQRLIEDASQPEVVTDSITLSSLSAPGGEYLFELNAEYRIDAIPYLYLELAFFTDVGNVWLNRSTTRWLAGYDQTSVPDDFSSPATLSADNLSLGWDVGMGFRFDASFLIIRIDLGQQLYSPALGGWVIKLDEPFLRQIRPNPSLAIGYPF